MAKTKAPAPARLWSRERGKKVPGEEKKKNVGRSLDLGEVQDGNG